MKNKIFTIFLSLSVIFSSFAFAGIFDSPRPDEQSLGSSRPAGSARIYGLAVLMMETKVFINGKEIKDINHGYATFYVKPGKTDLVVKLGNKQEFKKEITLKADEEFYFVVKPVFGGQMEMVADKDKFDSYYDDSLSKAKSRKHSGSALQNLGSTDLSK